MDKGSSFVQYFNIEKMARFPNGADALLTTRMGVYSKLAAVQSAKGGTVFVISGYGKPKKYVLWEAFTIEDVTKQDDQFVVSGPGRVLLPPAPLEGKEFEKFKTACANFVGFRKIDDHPYRDTLRQIADADKKSKLSPKCEAFCDELIAAFPKMGDAYYYRAHVRQHLGNAAGAKADYEQAIKLGTTFPDEARNQESGGRSQESGKATAGIAAQVVAKGAFAVKAPPGVSDVAWRGVVQRRGSEDFRQKVIAAYGGKCAVTGCDAEAALEVALIDPDGPNEVTNALPLRADLRTLFDLNLLRIHPKSRKVLLAEAVQDSSYARLWARPVRAPESKDHHPGVALLKRWDALR
ncbi:MAG TPA: HNH endonuclease signature motif containing protein [Gemmataceae bacterium]|nr:HNH endonuclease signature motif containing protein [Gemmataceae bacterium]